MPSSKGSKEMREFLFRVLHKRGAEEAEVLVCLLIERFPDLDEEKAGEFLWSLIDSHVLSVTDEAAVESAQAVGG